MKNFDYSLDIPKSLEKELRNAKYIGQGHNGIIFMLSDKKIVKFFRKITAWEDESDILKRVHRSKFFPKIYDSGPKYIIREYVDGVRLDKYLSDNAINNRICEELYDMLKEFERLNFTRLDIRCKDLFVQKDYSIRIIDPKNNYKKIVPYPRHLMKGLEKRGALDYFLNYVEKKNIRNYIYWKYKFDNYKEEIKEK